MQSNGGVQQVRVDLAGDHGHQQVQHVAQSQEALYLLGQDLQGGDDSDHKQR